MKVYILWVRHCESCANVVNFSKFKNRWLTDMKQGLEIAPNCTIIGLIQSFMFGYILLPEFLKLYPQFKKIDYYCSLLKRTMITNKLISHGLKKSGNKIKTSKSIRRLCNITEKRTPYEKITKKEVNEVSLKTSNKHVKEVNRKYKRTGKKITKRIRKRTRNCHKTNHDVFLEKTLFTLNHESLNVIVCHGEIMKKIFKLKSINNVDSIFVEYDKEKNSRKILNKIINKTNLADVRTSYKRINDERFYLHYKGKNLNVKSDISLDEFEKQVKGLKINFKKRDNEITCDKK